MNTGSIPSLQPENSCWDFAGKTNKEFALNADKENCSGLLKVDVDVPVAVIPSMTSPEGG